MTPEPYHAQYRWTEYKRELKRREDERRHALAALLGLLTALVCVSGIVYLLS